jgi:hypothetical protein
MVWSRLFLSVTRIVGPIAGCARRQPWDQRGLQSSGIDLYIGNEHLEARIAWAPCPARLSRLCRAPLRARHRMGTEVNAKFATSVNTDRPTTTGNRTPGRGVTVLVMAASDAKTPQTGQKKAERHRCRPARLTVRFLSATSAAASPYPAIQPRFAACRCTGRWEVRPR